MTTTPYKRHKDDFYPTPPECTHALLEAEGLVLPYEVWEPACGDGAISKILEASSRHVISTDLVDRGYGESGHDFLMARTARCRAIVTNPPFKLATQFIDHAFCMRNNGQVDYMAMLLPALFWHAQSRADLFEAWRPRRIYALGWRPDMFGIGQPDQRCTYIWTVWDGNATRTSYSILKKPRGL